ncbi:unnamed protein product [Protopolystoma xenopodis]|uniref:Uncharacterized protein n=1 Tax=Protopolystoma xenopodis TaxID=117903 RepID=A0A3S5CMN9_9PLAT|nr:unnamed protein product [Protopolystoma xenopodis]
MMPTTMAAKRLRMYQVHCQMLGIKTTTTADDFGLGAFYIVSLNTRPSCDNEVNPLLADDVGLGAFYMVSLKTRPSCYNEVNPLVALTTRPSCDNDSRRLRTRCVLLSRPDNKTKLRQRGQTNSD